MSIVRDDSDDRQARIARMVGEFHEARARRLAKASLAKADAGTMRVEPDVHAQTAVAVSAARPRASTKVTPDRE